MKTLGIIFITAGLVHGCRPAAEKVKKDFMPAARGEVDEIILVIDSAQWKSQLGEEIKNVYQDYLKVLNQDEFEFSLNRVSPIKFNSVLQNAKNLILAMTLDSKSRESRSVREFFTDNSLKMIQRDSSLYYTVRKDEFAKGQVVLYLFGQNEGQLARKIKKNKEVLKALFASEVAKRAKENVLSKTKGNLMKAVTENHGYRISIPFGYDLAKDLKDFIWLRKLEAQAEHNVFVYEKPYNDPVFYQKIDELRDNVTGMFLRDSEKPAIYIERQEIVPTYTKRVDFNGKFAVEARGLWKISDNSGGGPYVSYTFVDEPAQKLYYIEGYVYSPGEKKKKLIREVDAILNSFKTPTELTHPEIKK